MRLDDLTGSQRAALGILIARADAGHPTWASSRNGRTFAVSASLRALTDRGLAEQIESRAHTARFLPTELGRLLALNGEIPDPEQPPDDGLACRRLGCRVPLDRHLVTIAARVATPTTPA